MWLIAIGIALAWVAARSLMLLDWLWHGGFITSDLAYYFAVINSPDDVALIEYPAPILWLMRALRLVAGGEYGTFFVLFVVLIVALDAFVTAYLLWRASPIAAGYWIMFLTLLGPIMWFRIDLIPAVFVTLGLTEMMRHPRFCGTMLAAGAAAKLWPALLILPLSGRDTASKRRIISFAIVGAALAAASVLITGWERSASAISWQIGRGLHIESLPATWLMIKKATPGNSLLIEMSPYNAFELFGPGVSAALTMASALLVVAIACTIGLTIILLRRPGGARFAYLLAATAIIVAMIATNKTFSPQYLIWLAGPLGLMLAWANTPLQHRLATKVAVLGCVIAALTQLVFPLFYIGLLQNPATSTGITVVLVVRNVLMAILALWLMVAAFLTAWRQSGTGK